MSAPVLPTLRSAGSVVEEIRAAGPALVTLSGGVDSSLVASLAWEALGEHAIAITLSGPAVATREVERARRIARSIGISHRVVDHDPLAHESYRRNPTNRCFFCREGEAERMIAIGRPLGVRQYLDGVHADDLGDDRPGLRALDRAGFRHPLLRAGWRKSDVRAIARARGLPNWDEPSDACLASRIAHGQLIEVDLLRRIERSEAAIRQYGFRRVRVRVAGTAARVEVDPDEVPRLLEANMASKVRTAVGAEGFAPIVLDPEGYHASSAARGRRGV